MLETFWEEQLYLIAPTLSIGAVFSFILVYFKISDFFDKKRKNPLKENLLRIPGAGLLKKIDEIQDKYTENIILIMLVTLALVPFFSAHFFMGKYNPIFAILLGLAFLIFLIHRTRKADNLIKQKRKLRLGFECEMAVGQELNQLLREGYYVFHDFEIEKKFNIDHIVIGNGWIFAVETKGRSKLANDKSNVDNSKLIFDGEKLIFPAWIETKPIEQANNNAKCLENWIKKNTGEEVKIIPILTLPGWFVEDKSNKPDKKTSKLRVINPKQLAYKLKNYGKGEISTELVKKTEKIAHKIEEKCRDIEPKAYKNV